MMRVLKDKYLNKSIIVSLICIFCLIGMSYVFMSYKLNKYQKDEFLKYANVIGATINNTGDVDKIIDVAVEGKLIQANVEEGLKHLNKYGYFENMNIENKWIGNTFVEIRALSLKMNIAFVICIFILASYIIYGLIKKINIVSEGLEKLSINEEFESLKETEEGIIGLLYHRYNLACSRMKWWINEVKDERNKLKELLSELSHQLKTPIASIKMNNELILEGYVDKTEEKEFLIINNENIDRMEWITTGLLKLSTLESKYITLNKEMGSLKETVIDSINAVYGKALEKDINIDILSLDEAELVHDKKWLKESIINILDNSIKYSLCNKKIEVSLKNEVSKVIINIKDNGYGIKKEDREKIFKRFYRSYDEKVQKEEGSGIGLYLSKKIIIEHEGSLKVESTYGEGSQFTIILYRHLID